MGPNFVVLLGGGMNAKCGPTFVVPNFGRTSPTSVVPKEHAIPWSTEQLTETFRSYDANKDGQLSWDELKAAFKYLGSHAGGLRTAKGMYYADNDNDGFINLANYELTELVKYANTCGYKVG